ncbi:type III toxin-antitoxin system ToxN/AbiQ family toxin [Lactobacillus helveticus]|uniref:type III toxin-antitoxin system ToxN/AbiQ family toxin n=1 Tax=Lactobacillus helveticus TaxID=1587 RepID=UPI0021ACE6AD|nr:type III toxin-antitoxin system ToxN/AbiQ family toxin [Lactobacillus helveticus]
MKKHFAGVVHLNYIFPAPESAIFNVTAQNITNFRRFSTEQQKSKYIDLLSKEPKVINNQENIASRAYKL